MGRLTTAFVLILGADKAVRKVRAKRRRPAGLADHWATRGASAPAGTGGLR
jgi:hypothetical protein